MLKDPESKAIRDRLKRTTEPLGVARNLDVLLSQTLAEIQDRRPDDLEILNLEKSFAHQRREAYAEVERLLQSSEWKRLVLDVYAWLHGGRWRSPREMDARRTLALPLTDFAATTLDHRLKQVRRRGKKLSEKSDTARHQLRIAAKKLRYGSEFFAALYDGKKAEARHDAFVDALKTLQDHLGDLNDIVTAKHLFDGQQRADSRSVVFAAGVSSASADQRKASLIEQAAEAHRKLMAATPFWH